MAEDTKQPKITVIIPIYNMEKYLRDSLSSIIAQDYSGVFRVILVDDCSTDSSANICQEYVESHPTIFSLVKHKENAGCSTARNTGLELVNTMYVMFVDPDDRLPSHALSTLCKSIDKSGADVVKGNYLNFREDSEDFLARRGKQELFHGDDCLRVFLRHKKTSGHVWGKIFRTEKIQGLRFVPNYAMAEDLLFCAEVFSRSQKFLIIPDVVYEYRRHDEGAVAKKFSNGTYLTWFNVISDVAPLCKTIAHQRAYFGLQLKTLLWLAGEARQLSHSEKDKVLRQIRRQRQAWDIFIYRVCLPKKLLFFNVKPILKIKKSPIRFTERSVISDFN